MFARSMLAGCALLVAFAAPAGAATFTSTPDGLLFTAASGISNTLGVFGDPAPPPTLVISTANDPVVYSAGSPLPAGCADDDSSPNASPASVISCSGTPVITFDLGDRNDDYTGIGTTSNITVLGGPGFDVLDGGDGGQTLKGQGDSDQLNGGPGADFLEGGDTFDSLRGNEGDDEIRGGDGEDFIRGDDGDDRLFGDAGGDSIRGGTLDDTIEGGAGDDDLRPDTGVDVVRGEAGNDYVDAFADGAVDDLDGGNGVDTLEFDADVTLSIDLAGDVVTDVFGDTTVTDRASGFEDAYGSAQATTLLGTAGPNVITGDYGADTVDPRAGNDVVNTSDGDDTVDARDGFLDRIACGEGVDSVQADALDDVQPDCENVTRTDVGNANDVPEDKAPTVAITAPAASAVLSTVAANTITAQASDDRGIGRVVFSTGERVLCTDATAPYSCDYRPTSADVGRDTLVAVAFDTAGQTASAVRVVSVPRFKATALTATTTPKRDRKAPFRFTTKGKLALPAGVTPAAGCKGTVAVSFKAGKKTVSTRRVALKSDCTYRSRVTFRLPRRLNPKTLSVSAVFGGNEVVEATQARRRTVRPR